MGVHVGRPLVKKDGKLFCRQPWGELVELRKPPPPPPPPRPVPVYDCSVFYENIKREVERFNLHNQEGIEVFVTIKSCRRKIEHEKKM